MFNEFLYHPATIEALKYEIENAIHEIEAQTVEYVLKNWVDRMGYCKPNHTFEKIYILFFL